MIILRAWMNATFNTSMEVEVEICSEEGLTGERRTTSRAFLTFVAVDESETDEERARAQGAQVRREERLRRRQSV